MGQKKKVKLEDIADALGVSIVTVSNALKGKKGVSEELRKKITLEAERMGYRVTVRENTAKNSYMIGVIVAERYVKEFPSFYLEVYRYIAQDAAKRGHLTVLEVATPEKEQLEEGDLVFQESGLDGIILIGELRRKYIEALRKFYSEIPLVCLDYYDVYEDMDYIVTDGFGGMEQVTRMFLKEGYRDLIFVGSVNATKNITDRYLGFCKALEKTGIDENENRIINDRDFEGGDYKLSIKIPEKLPEGFVCNCDKTALLLIEKLKEQGIRVPEDVSVAGFDGYPPSDHKGFRLSTYENDGKAIAHISVSTLINRIEGKKPEGVRIVEGRIVRGNTIAFRREK